MVGKKTASQRGIYSTEYQYLHFELVYINAYRLGSSLAAVYGSKRSACPRPDDILRDKQDSQAEEPDQEIPPEGGIKDKSPMDR